MTLFKKIGFWRIFCIAILAISIVPLLRISFYNHACADDFSYGLLTRTAWNTTGNILEVFKAMCQQIKTTYFSWQGSYSAVALFTIQPGIWSDDFYFLSTFILLGIYIFSNFYFFRSVFKPFKTGRYIADIIASVVCILSIQLLPSAVQGFFWWNGSSYYVIFYSLMIIQLTQFIKMCYENRCSVVKFLLSCILGIMIAGGNYISALLISEITCAFLLYSFIIKKDFKIKLLGIAIVTMIAFSINVIAPGNAVRQTNFVGMSPLKAIMYSFYEAFVYLSEWTSPFLVIALLFLLPFVIKLLSDVRIVLPKYYSLFLIFCLLFALFASSFTPTLYAYASEGPGRVQNIRFFMFIFLAVCAEVMTVYYIMALGWKIDNYEFIKKLFISDCSTKTVTTFFVGIIIVICFFISNFVLTENTNKLTSVSAVESLYNGEAKLYDDVADERTKLLLSEAKQVYLMDFPAKPYVLFFDDVQTNPEDWRNRSVANFYGKDMVYLG